MVEVGRPLAERNFTMAGGQSLVVFEGLEDLIFSRAEVKNPTLPKTGRVGHPKNLKRHVGVD